MSHTASLNESYTSPSAEAPWLPRILAVLLLFFAVKYALRGALDRNPWYIGDWLINYTGGFIRRGLAGELALLLSRTIHIPAVWIVFTASLLFYLIFLKFAYSLVANMPLTWLVPLLVLSPAAFAFEVLDPEVCFRKEVLLFACMAFLAGTSWLCAASRPAIVGCLCLVLILMGLCHEALLVYAPYLFCLVLIKRPGDRKLLFLLTVPAAVMLLTFSIVAHHPGNFAAATEVCRSIGGTLRPFGENKGTLCGGSVSWLQMNTQTARAFVEACFRRYHYLPIYLCYAALSSLPIALALIHLHRKDSARRSVHLLIAAAAVTSLLTVPLFLYSLDWGRWIHIHVICITLILLVILRGSAGRPKARPAADYAAKRRLLATVLFLACWVLPTAITAPFHPVYGYFGVFNNLYSAKIAAFLHRHQRQTETAAGFGRLDFRAHRPW